MILKCCSRLKYTRRFAPVERWEDGLKLYKISLTTSANPLIFFYYFISYSIRLTQHYQPSKCQTEITTGALSHGQASLTISCKRSLSFSQIYLQLLHRVTLTITDTDSDSGDKQKNTLLVVSKQYYAVVTYRRRRGTL